MRKKLIALLSVLFAIFIFATAAKAQQAQSVFLGPTSLQIEALPGSNLTDAELEAAARQVACMSPQAAGMEVSSLKRMMPVQYEAEVRRLAGMPAASSCTGKDAFKFSVTAENAPDSVRAFKLMRTAAISDAEINNARELFAHVMCATDRPQEVFDSLARSDRQFEMDAWRRWAETHPVRSGCGITSGAVKYQRQTPNCRLGKPGNCEYEVDLEYRQAVANPRYAVLSWTPVSTSKVPGPGFYCFRGAGQAIVCVAALVAAACLIDLATGRKVCGHHSETPGGKSRGAPIPPPANGDVVAADGPASAIGFSPPAFMPLAGFAPSSGGTKFYIGAQMSISLIHKIH